MSEQAIEYFIKICNKHGIAEGFKATIVSSLIKDVNAYKKFYVVYLQLNTARKQHENLKDEIEECLDIIGCEWCENNKIKRKEVE